MSGRGWEAIPTHPIRLLLVSCALTIALCGIALSLLVPQRSVARELPISSARGVSPRATVPLAPAPEPLPPLPACEPSGPTLGADPSASRLPAPTWAGSSDPDDEDLADEDPASGTLADSTPVESLADTRGFAQEVRAEHVGHYGSRLGLSDAQKDVLDRLLAERQTVAQNPRIIVGLPEAMRVFRQYLDVEQVRNLDLMLAGDR